jgi:hypothetical protein
MELNLFLSKIISYYSSTDHTDSATIELCSTYIEEKKSQEHETITQRVFSIDFINNLIHTQNTISLEDLQRKIPAAVKIQLVKQLGYVGQNIIKSLIKICTTDKQQHIKEHHYLQLLAANFDPLQASPSNTLWNENLFSTNNIQIPDFFARFLLIPSMCIPKSNTFVLQGSTNTGKSFLLSLLLEDTHPTRISREKDRSTFHLDQLPNSTAVVFEEPVIDQTTISTFFNLYSGGWSPNWVHSARLPLTGLLYLPRVIVRMENLV